MDYMKIFMSGSRCFDNVRCDMAQNKIDRKENCNADRRDNSNS